MFTTLKDTKEARKALYGTSYFGNFIHCSKSDLTEMLGEPTIHKEFGEFTKTFNEWILETDEGFIIAVYDYWTEGDDVSYGYYENLDWHIGARTEKNAEKAYYMLKDMLDEMYEPFEEFNRRNQEEFEQYYERY